MFEGRFGKIKLTTENREIRKISISGVVVRGSGAKGSLIMPGCWGF